MLVQTTIVWFRQDLRLTDNPALSYAAAKQKPIIPIYIQDTDQDFAIGGASKWWLHQSLECLSKNLGYKLNFFQGKPQEIISQIIAEHNVDEVVWNRCYEQVVISRDKKIKENLKARNITVKSFNASLLLEAQDTLKEDKTNYKVFTPFYKKNYLSGVKQIRQPLEKPANLDLQKIKSLALEDLTLMPKIKWYEGFELLWQPGEEGANKRFDDFIQNGITNYKELRNRPDLNHTSGLSPHLHFGEISPNTIWHRVKNFSENQAYNADAEHFLSELGWREFSYNLLYFYPQLPRKNWQEKFDHFPWQENESLLKAWQKGQTGYPIVDAGMRELWQTGFMHNRVRMIVASFLIKHLMIDWRCGAEWFFDCVVDADVASNGASWQWVAGSGADAAPYFRIFNPILQGEKFDPEGVYTKKFVPELKNMPLKYLFAPWLAPDSLKMGINYPPPIVDHQKARARALGAYKSIVFPPDNTHRSL